MRLINADALINTLQELFDKREKEQMFTGSRGACVTWNDAIYCIKTAPTIDAVPVVRCKDCKWFGDFGCAIRIVDDSDKPTENDFCSFAERSETE